MANTHYTAKLIVHQKTVKRIHSNHYGRLLANLISNLESGFPTGVGLIRDNLQGSVVQRIKRVAIVD